MFELNVKKVIARCGEREIVPSSQEEMQRFVVEGIRPDFDDDSILCIKFLQSSGDEEPEESRWYINPTHSTNVVGLFDSTYAYGPAMDTSFEPEILFVPFEDEADVKRRLSSFNNRLHEQSNSNLICLKKA